MNIIRNKLFEDPDTSYVRDSDPLNWFEDVAYPFSVNIMRSEVKVGRQNTTHEDLSKDSAFSYTDYEGRIWPEAGVISFWEAPTKSLLLHIWKKLIHNPKLKMYTIHEDEIHDILFDIPNPDQSSNEEDLICTYADYPDNPKITVKNKKFEVKKRLKHTLSPLKKQTKLGSYTGGSKLTAWDAKNNIKARQAMYAESFYSRLEEAIPKNKWVNVDPEEHSEELIELVQTAYKKSPEGSFINTKKDLIEPDWNSIDFDDDSKLDVTIFYRGPRKNETWKGKKIQGIGHDGSREAVNLLLSRLKSLLNKKGNWIEASDAVEHILYKMGVHYIDDEKTAQLIFPNSNLKFIGDKGKYTRDISTKTIKETIFGYPILSEKIFETPNNIINPQVWNRRKDNPSYTPSQKDTLTYKGDESNIPFGYYGPKGERTLIIGKYSDTHFDVLRKAGRILVPRDSTLTNKEVWDLLGEQRGDRAGRLFPKYKTITFWSFPKTYEDLLKVIADLNKQIGPEIKIDDTWLVEIPSGEFKKGMESGGGWGSWTPRVGHQEFIPVSQYKGGHKRSEEEMGMEHIKSPMQKLNKKVPYGVGSKHSKYKEKRNWERAKPFESYYPRLSKSIKEDIDKITKL